MQEALTNIVRHAGATRVRIRLHRSPHELLLTVQDDGKGFDAENDGGGTSLGILGMRERAISSGATFEIDSRPGEGTCITVRVPVHKGQDAVDKAGDTDGAGDVDGGAAGGGGDDDTP